MTKLLDTLTDPLLDNGFKGFPRTHAPMRRSKVHARSFS